ncbi:MAG: hypothetical protein V2I67_08275 [Thermoanaerobaculales bacterium]|jgi:hypothetical protein|nr:hypothetical protein [Thermoanaerobaculales bacterium]
MKRTVLASLAVLVAAMHCAADDVGRIVGNVEAVYHEGAVTFTVLHPEAVSASVKIYDLDSDALIFDSGPRARTQLSWQAGRDFDGGTRYLVTAWNSDGEVVISQTAANQAQSPISEISFDTIPDMTAFVGAGEIDMLGDVNVGAIPGIKLYQNYEGKGGAFEIFDDEGFFKSAYLVPIGGDPFEYGAHFRIQGNYGGIFLMTEHGLHGDEPGLGVFGTSEFFVWAGETGDDSVVMPDDAVSAAEMKDEPGVAAVFSEDLVNLIPSDNTTVLFANVFGAPPYGYTFATGSVRVQINADDGGESVTCWLDDGRVTTSHVSVAVGSWQPSYLTWNYYLSLSGLFLGARRVEITCTSTGFTATGNVAIDRHLELIWFPTAYGTVSVPED